MSAAHRRWVACPRSDDIAEARLEPVPPGRERAADVPHVLVVEEQERAEAVTLHGLVSPLQAPVTDVGPVDASFQSVLRPRKASLITPFLQSLVSFVYCSRPHG